MDDAFARDLFDACAAPEDALAVLRPLVFPVATCSRQRPYGIHSDLGGGGCPRCGWTPRRRRPRRN